MRPILLHFVFNFVENVRELVLTLFQGDFVLLDLVVRFTGATLSCITLPEPKRHYLANGALLVALNGQGLFEAVKPLLDVDQLLLVVSIGLEL